jgi:hypothetical protein
MSLGIREMGSVMQMSMMKHACVPIVYHLEVFTFENLKSFIEKAKTEYARPLEELSDEEKKLRPKENQLFIKKDVTRYVKESYTYAKLTEADWLRDKTDKTLNILKVSNKPQKIKKDSILKINPTKDGSRYKIFSVEEGDSEVQSVVSADSSEKWSVYEKSIEIFHGFHEIPKEVNQYYVNVSQPLKPLKKLKDKEGTEYIQIDKIASIEIYVKDDEKYKTHGITFSNFTLIDEAGADKIGIFEDASKYYEKKTEEDGTPQQEKEKLNDTFKSILQEIKIDKDKNGKLEAGEFASLSLTKEKRKELSYMMVKHESEWEYEKDKFQPILDYLDQDTKLEKHKAMFEDRLEKLAFFPKGLVGKGRVPTFIHPIALVEGFVGGSRFDWSKTPIIKLIISKESKGSYSAYNITGWTTSGTNKVYESHFKAEGTYLITTMTITEIKLAQSTMVGINRKHLFAIGLYQVIPKTFEAKINIRNKAGKITGTKLVGFLPWVKRKTTVKESIQLFDEKFQDMMPIYFWESKQKNIGRYFKGTKTSTDAAYAVSKEWASAGVPNGLMIKSGVESKGKTSYYGGDGLNSAHYTGADTIKALEETKVMLDAYGGYDKVIKESFN